MKKTICLFFTLSLLLSLSACANATPPGTETAEQTASTSDADLTASNLSIREALFGDAELSTDNKRMLLTLTYPSQVTITADESCRLELPFEAEEVSFSSDNSLVAQVDENGNITPYGDGACIITTKADGIYQYTVLVVQGTGSTLIDAPYAAFSMSDFDAGVVKKELETYGSATFGFAISDDVDDKDLIYENSFTVAAEHSGCKVKYKLFTTLNCLYEQGYTNIAVRISTEDPENVVVQFYAK